MGRRGKVKRGYAIYLVTLGFLAALVGLFFPLIGEKTDLGPVIYFNSIPLIFGGVQASTIEGVYYEFVFSLNIPIIAFGILQIAGAFSSLASRNSPRSIALTMVLSVISIVGLAFLPWVIRSTNPAILEGNLVYGAGFYVSLLASILSLVVGIIELVLSIRYWHKRNAFR